MNQRLAFLLVAVVGAAAGTWALWPDCDEPAAPRESGSPRGRMNTLDAPVLLPRPSENDPASAGGERSASLGAPGGQQQGTIGASTVRGKVVDANSRGPVAGFSVRLDPQRPQLGTASRGFLSTTQTDGAFEFSGISEGEYVLSAERRQSHVVPPLRITLGSQTLDPIVLMAYRRLALAGRVIRAGSGEPIPRFPMQARSTETGIVRTVTRDDGSFSFNPTPWSGAVELAASADPARVLAAVDMRGDLQDVVLVWDGAGAIDGRVVDSAGAPVSGSVVSLAGDGDVSLPLRQQDNVWAIGPTLADGSFHISDLPGGRSYRVIAHAEGYSDAITDETLVPSAGLLITLARAGTLVGIARDADGLLRSGLVAWCAAQTDGRSPAQLVADAEGRFRLSLPPGRYVVTPAGEFEFEKQSLDVRPGEETLIELVGRAGVSIVGLVVDTQGAPTAAAQGERGGRKALLKLRVSARSAANGGGMQRQESTVGPAGEFALWGLQSGIEYEVTVRTEDGLDATVPTRVIAPGRVRLTWSPPESRLRVLVRDDAGKDLTGADVWVVAGGRAKLLASPAAVLMRPGSVTVLVGGPGNGSIRKELEIAVGVQEVGVVLGRGRVVEGLVLTEDGVGVRGVRVCAAEGEFGFPSTAVVTDEEGRFTINSLPVFGGALGILTDGALVTSYPVSGDRMEIRLRGRPAR